MKGWAEQRTQKRRCSSGHRRLLPASRHKGLPLRAQPQQSQEGWAQVARRARPETGPEAHAGLLERPAALALLAAYAGGHGVLPGVGGAPLGAAAPLRQHVVDGAGRGAAVGAPAAVADEYLAARPT